ncbi:MAG TPA: M56 family metallopeptidase [Blastocatellia bacterium]|nr:M56 family metallopeptidase [Blastocatellia bacterium]
MRTISELLLTFLLNACWQIALITAAAALCARLLRGTTPRYQHLLWVIALAFSFGLPVLTCLPPSGGVDFSEAPRTIVLPASEGYVPAPQLIQDMQEAPPSSTPPTLNKAVPFIPIDRKVAVAVLILYLLFLGYRSGKLCMAWRKARSLKRSACPIDLPEPVRTTVSECQTALGVRRVRVLCSTSIPAPIAVGALDPLIILPERLLRETDRGVLIAAIGHELVHIKRRDYSLNLICELISLPLLFHPVTALVKRRIRETRELSCDEMVTEKLLDAAVYARSLVHLASSAVDMSRPDRTITVGIADADILEERVMTILRRPKINNRRKNLLLVAASLFFLVPCVAAAPFALRVGFNPEAAAKAPQSSLAPPQATVVTSQQDAGRLTKQEEQAREEQKRKELLEQRLKREGIELEARSRSAKQDVEAKYKEALEYEERARAELNAKMLEAHQGLSQEQEEKRKLRELEERARAEMEAKERDPEYMARRRMEQKIAARRQAELAKKANVPMQQAIQIAMSQQAGTVMECRLIGERPAGEKDQVFYILTIVSGDEPESASTRMLISAIDGRVVRTWKDEK